MSIIVYDKWTQRRYTVHYYTVNLRICLNVWLLTQNGLSTRSRVFLCLRNLCPLEALFFSPCPSPCLGVCRGVCPMPLVFLLLRKNTKWISMKFARGNRHNQQIKRLHVGRNCNITRRKLRIDVNRCCRDVKQVLTPSEWIHQLHCTY